MVKKIIVHVRSRRIIDRLICSKILGLFYEIKYVEGKKGNVS